ncbi:DUF3006 domain-containing protein [Haloplanus salinus]|jgi:hypothetical protein|uniref:DUF3006 domain-containing protein n=1 Tax=Haloplanus salinus TaxID=1126245 RepID=A0A368N7A7_9EURY|nr:DUF3006 family protein [Haloplanus salinus]RCU45990.1 DUF3006 domain-containing protein [Haloplanus salinus]
MTDIDALADGCYTAVVDSVEDGVATVFFEDDGEAVGDAVLDASALPEAARRADAVLRVTVRDGSLVGSEYDAERTADRADRAQERFDRLAERPPSDGDRDHRKSS